MRLAFGDNSETASITMRKEANFFFSGPVRRRLSSDDEFFDEGNLQRALLSKMSVFALLEEEQGEQDEEDSDVMGIAGGSQPAYECPFQDCSIKFSSLRRVEAHYETLHRNRCATCDRSFPTHRLLDIHLSEAHDSFFKAMAERKPMYICLVEGCRKTFWSTGKRHAHLVEIHRYPENFDFSRPSLERTRRDGRDRAKRVARCRRKQQQQQQQQQQQLAAQASAAGSAEPAVAPAIETWDKSESDRVESIKVMRGVNGGEPTAEDGGDMDVEGCGEAVAGEQAPSNREKSLPKGATGPRKRAPRKCKFWRTREGCRAGSRCKFRHDAPEPRGMRKGTVIGAEQEAAARQEGSGSAGGAEDGVEEGGHGAGIILASKIGVEGSGMVAAGVDELVVGMKKLSIPTTLSFGRTARRGRLLGSAKR